MIRISYFLSVFCLFSGQLMHGQIFKGKESVIHFLSKSSLEDIEARNTVPIIMADFSTGNVQAKIPNKSFKFSSSFMEEHFNENYMETDKYPVSSFKGKIKEKVDYTKDGEYKVTCEGELDMHGVTNKVVILGVVKVNGGIITLKADFKVKLVDYKIKVPSMYVKNIAEEIGIDLATVMEPLKKP